MGLIFFLNLFSYNYSYRFSGIFFFFNSIVTAETFSRGVWDMEEKNEPVINNSVSEPRIIADDKM